MVPGYTYRGPNNVHASVALQRRAVHVYDPVLQYAHSASVPNQCTMLHTCPHSESDCVHAYSECGARKARRGQSEARG